ncbi:MAG: L-seryl-tRNA(Sec) selenium transferase [Fimbriiglobus sp.]
MSNALRDLPAVHRLLAEPQIAALSPVLAREAIAEVLGRWREAVTKQGQVLPGFEAIVAEVVLKATTMSAAGFREVLNATGIILHTNLGRSPLAEVAAHAAYEAARGYLNLEMDLASGERSSRQNPIRERLARLTGAESATVVNNCAAATILVLRTLAQGREVIVSRGQLVEIGGSFRIPDIMAVSGAKLVEVGTTNITRIADYERAITPQTAAMMRIHTSNYRITGFTETPSIQDLVRLGQTHHIPVVDDVGSGLAVDLSPWGLTGEPSIREGMEAGADLVLFSGDKLLGGPQAGIIAGRKVWIDRLERDPMMRAFRTDKMTLAALDATLKLYDDPTSALAQIPTLRMLTTPVEELRGRCEALQARLGLGQVLEETAFVGGGSLPTIVMPTVVVAIRPPGREAEFAKCLRIGKPAVVARVQDGQVLIDLRCIRPDQEAILAERLRECLHIPQA